MENEHEGFPITSLREIKIMMLYKHPNIVNVLEVVVGSNLSSVFIVMEYLDHNLKGLVVPTHVIRLISQMETMKTPFLQSETKCLMLQLLKAVAHLHRHWIIHRCVVFDYISYGTRDIKSSNLLYDNKGNLKLAVCTKLFLLNRTGFWNGQRIR